MKVNSAIRKVMKETKITQTRLAEILGEKHQSVISERLRQNNISINLAMEMLDVMGYELVIQPKKPGRRPEGQILITMEDGEEE